VLRRGLLVGLLVGQCHRAVSQNTSGFRWDNQDGTNTIGGNSVQVQYDVENLSHNPCCGTPLTTGNPNITAGQLITTGEVTDRFFVNPTITYDPSGLANVSMDEDGYVHVYLVGTSSNKTAVLVMYNFSRSPAPFRWIVGGSVVSSGSTAVGSSASLTMTTNGTPATVLGQMAEVSWDAITGEGFTNWVTVTQAESSDYAEGDTDSNPSIGRWWGYESPYLDFATSNGTRSLTNIIFSEPTNANQIAIEAAEATVHAINDSANLMSGAQANTATNLQTLASYLEHLNVNLTNNLTVSVSPTNILSVSNVNGFPTNLFEQIASNTLSLSNWYEGARVAATNNNTNGLFGTYSNFGMSFIPGGTPVFVPSSALTNDIDGDPDMDASMLTVDIPFGEKIGLRTVSFDPFSNVKWAAVLAWIKLCVAWLLQALFTWAVLRLFSDRWLRMWEVNPPSINNLVAVVPIFGVPWRTAVVGCLVLLIMLFPGLALSLLAGPSIPSGALTGPSGLKGLVAGAAAPFVNTAWYLVDEFIPWRSAIALSFGYLWAWMGFDAIYGFVCASLKSVGILSSLAFVVGGSVSGRADFFIHVTNVGVTNVAFGGSSGAPFFVVAPGQDVHLRRVVALTGTNNLRIYTYPWSNYVGQLDLGGSVSPWADSAVVEFLANEECNVWWESSPLMWFGAGSSLGALVVGFVVLRRIAWKGLRLAGGSG